MLILFILTFYLSAGQVLADSRTCSAYANKIMPPTNDGRGYPSRAQMVAGLCGEPEMARLEADNDRAIQLAKEVVTRRLESAAVVKQTSSLIISATALMKDWKSRLQECKKSADPIVACADVEIDIGVELKDLWAKIKAATENLDKINGSLSSPLREFHLTATFVSLVFRLKTWTSSLESRK